MWLNLGSVIHLTKTVNRLETLKTKSPPWLPSWYCLECILIPNPTSSKLTPTAMCVQYLWYECHVALKWAPLFNTCMRCCMVDGSSTLSTIFIMCSMCSSCASWSPWWWCSCSSVERNSGEGCSGWGWVESLWRSWSESSAILDRQTLKRGELWQIDACDIFFFARITVHYRGSHEKYLKVNFPINILWIKKSS